MPVGQRRVQKGPGMYQLGGCGGEPGWLRFALWASGAKRGMGDTATVVRSTGHWRSDLCKVPTTTPQLH